MTIWETLGIDATTDESAIRRAYARQLKLHRPDKDPQGYQQLRETFDLAKQYASNAAMWQDEEEDEPAADEAGHSEVTLSSAQDYLHTLEGHHDIALQPDWQRETLEDDAARFSVRLLTDEMPALKALREYLDHELPDALDARAVFSLALAQALSERKGITRSLVSEVSDIMGWELDGYRVRHIPHWVVEAIEQQVALSEAEEHWAYLARQGANDRQAKLAWRLLSGEVKRVPWWAKLIPGFTQQLVNHVATIKYHYPQLLDRLNPELLEYISSPHFLLSWREVAALWFWGVAAWLQVRVAPAMAGQAAAIVGSLIVYLWVMPLLLAYYAQGKRSARAVLPLLWLLGWIMLAIPLFHLYEVVFSYPPVYKGVSRVMMLTAVLAYPAWWVISRNRHQWYAMPFKGVAFMFMLPIVFLQQFSPIITAVGVIILPALFTHVLRGLFFFY